jgi:hypothetical protein
MVYYVSPLTTVPTRQCNAKQPGLDMAAMVFPPLSLSEIR